ncbi:DeoR family transcriptional regulator [Brevibacillus sp. SKDU10]|uniref:DeoR/GlpR family DNA-binding transcription regulator n=1 Tax=Brevibacillus sp. SKDU10 TaxID=1247872 RepID=UPI0007C8A870|nr:DeoR/GlpR family DNA-binding transcription regulator [Brevibacillus sp. SKDU10]OAJ75372.1 DeoR family transcriptional regulator [Brevibacillus sp. SKDU10]
MLAIERRKKIMNMLFEQGNVMVTELSKQFSVSEETIRRDLDKLEKEGILVRTYGGAILEDGLRSDFPLWVRESYYVDVKQKLGEKCAQLIKSGDTIMLDSSTTSLYIAKKIKNKQNLTVITNSFKVELELSDAEHVKLISTGGTLQRRSLSYVSHSATRALSHYFADASFVSCTGLHLQRGATDSNEFEAEIRKLMLKNSEQKILVLDHTKIDKAGFTFITDFQGITKVITDQPLSVEWRQLLSRYNIEIDDEDIDTAFEETPSSP